MNEKINAVGATMMDKAKTFAKKESTLVAASMMFAGGMFAFTIGMKIGRKEAAALLGGLLTIYPKDNTVGQFLADINKLRE